MDPIQVTTASRDAGVTAAVEAILAMEPHLRHAMFRRVADLSEGAGTKPKRDAVEAFVRTRVVAERAFRVGPDQDRLGVLAVFPVTTGHPGKAATPTDIVDAIRRNAGGDGRLVESIEAWRSKGRAS